MGFAIEMIYLINELYQYYNFERLLFFYSITGKYTEIAVLFYVRVYLSEIHLTFYYSCSDTVNYTRSHDFQGDIQKEENSPTLQ